MSIIIINNTFPSILNISWKQFASCYIMVQKIMKYQLGYSVDQCFGLQKWTKSYLGIQKFWYMWAETEYPTSDRVQSSRPAKIFSFPKDGRFDAVFRTVRTGVQNVLEIRFYWYKTRMSVIQIIIIIAFFNPNIF